MNPLAILVVAHSKVRAQHALQQIVRIHMVLAVSMASAVTKKN
jgi:hypothetical protein